MKRPALLLLVTLACGCARQPELTTYYPVPEFSLIDQNDCAVIPRDRFHRARLDVDQRFTARISITGEPNRQVLPLSSI